MSNFYIDINELKKPKDKQGILYAYSNKNSAYSQSNKLQELFAYLRDYKMTKSRDLVDIITSIATGQLDENCK